MRSCGPARAAGSRSCGTSLGADGARIVPITSDLSQPGLGVSEEDLLEMPGKIDHLFHLAAVYDLTADAVAKETANVEGRAARSSSPARSGRLLPPGQLDRRRRALPGRLDRGHVRRGRTARQQPLLPHQARVRAARPRRVPAALARLPAGDRRRRLAHGEIDKIDGPYFMFKSLQRLRRVAPTLAAGPRDRRRRDQHRPG